MDDVVRQFILFWSVIDPIGTIPIFIAVTRGLKNPHEIRKIAYWATLIAALVLIFFVLVGEMILEALSIPLAAFQVSGGVILFLFALTMIFGESKPEEELDLIDKHIDSAVFPLAIPSIASPGAMMAAVLVTDANRYQFTEQLITVGTILTVLLVNLILMLLATRIMKVIGTAGASVISRIMGLLIASVAMQAILSGLQTYFQ